MGISAVREPPGTTLLLAKPCCWVNGLATARVSRIYNGRVEFGVNRACCIDEFRPQHLAGPHQRFGEDPHRCGSPNAPEGHSGCSGGVPGDVASLCNALACSRMIKRCWREAARVLPGVLWGRTEGWLSIRIRHTCPPKPLCHHQPQAHTQIRRLRKLGPSHAPNGTTAACNPTLIGF
jgi:hypothetical protein